MFGRAVIQKKLRKMYTVKSAFAKVARNRSIIFNYTLDQDFPIINLYFLLNNILVFFSSCYKWNEGDVVWILLQTFFFEWIKRSSFLFITEGWSFTTAFIVAKATNVNYYLQLRNIYSLNQKTLSNLFNDIMSFLLNQTDN